MFTMFAELAEYERALISERTKIGLEAARARGRKGGRKPKMTKAEIQIGLVLMKNRGWWSI